MAQRLLMVTIMYGKQPEEKVTVIVHINTSTPFFLVKTLIDQVIMIMMHFLNGKLDHYYNGSILLVLLLGCWVGIFL